MKCKKCGSEVAKGNVFCSNCGAEVQIVPDYSELDEKISKVFEPEKTQKVSIEEPQNEEPKTPMDKKKKALIIVASIIAFVAVVFGISVLITNNQKNKSFSYQLERAKEYYNNDLPDKALTSVNKALKIDKDNEEALLLLADIQVKLDDSEEAINTLLKVVDLYPNSVDGYSKLIDLYAAERDYQAISELSKNVSDEKVQSLFLGYVPVTPMFKTEPGNYDDVVMLEIQSDANSQIYYTTDGSSPETNGVVYTQEIKIEAGTTIIKAVASNEFGIFSEVVEGEYNIELAVPDKPVVSLPSGTYDDSKTISITVPAGCSAYYTWDGTTPTQQSMKYSGPFEIIEGNNVLSVVVINGNNQASDIARFNYIYHPVEDEDEE